MDKTKGNNFITIIFDSCRFDSFVAAQPKTILKLGTLERRLVIRDLDGAISLQPAHGSDAPHAS